MSENTVSSVVATRDNSPAGLVQQYKDSFAQVLPSHIKPETWVRLTQGALRRGKRVNDPKSPHHGKFELEAAALNNTGAFLAALLDAARQGLEPGTDEYYLTARKTKGQLEIKGIRGYQGEIQLIYRADMVASVIVEVVRQSDLFIWKPGAYDTQIPPRWEGPMTRPMHEADWFGQRGDLIGVYAYAVMKDGSVSKVVVLNRDHIALAKSKSDGVNSEYSPWNWNPESMWLKTAAHRLYKFVPKSSEYLRERLRSLAQAQDVQAVIAPAGPAISDMEDPSEPHEFSYQDDDDRCARCGGFIDDDVHGGQQS